MSQTATATISAAATCTQAEKNINLVHQNLCITEIDIANRRLVGYVELHFVPTKLKLTKIRLNAKQCSITKLLARGSGQYTNCTFTYNDPLLFVSDEKSLRKFDSNHDEAVISTEPEFGELIIQLSDEVQNDISDGSTFKILIEYILENPTAGLHFSTFSNQVFTYKNYNSSRLWFPCIDSYSTLR